MPQYNSNHLSLSLSGNVKIFRDSIVDLFRDYPLLDRAINGSTFKKSHSVSLGRTHLSGLVIDGYPLCHPILDNNIDSLGRFALCNSASSDATANVKLKWVPAPDLPADVVNNICDCECFVVSTRPIKKGEELLWNYPFAHHLSPAQAKTAVRRLPALAPDLAHPAPAPAVKPSEKQAVKRPAPAPSPETPDGLDADCLCPGDTKCKLGFCWFLGGRLVQSRRRK